MRWPPETFCRSDSECEQLTHFMGLDWIVVMHEPIEDSDGDHPILGVSRESEGQRLGTTSYNNPEGWWSRNRGFAFVVSQVGPQL